MRKKQKNGNAVQHALDVNVPSHWEVVPLEKVLDGIIGGGTPSKSNPIYWDGSIPWLTVKDMRSRRPQDAIDHISEDAVRESATNIIPADTVIIATRIGLGKVVRVPYDAAINQDLKALINKSEIDKGFLEYWILSIAGYLESIGSGTTVKGIRLEQLRSLPFPLAPFEQQKRIVAEIEKQFSRLDEAVANLKRVKANLKRYKAAVLKAAVEGKLTEEWRKQDPDIEPASKLLERILAERRKKWEVAELAKMKAKGKVPKDDKWKKKYKEPVKPELKGLFNIPSLWQWVTLGQLLQHIQAGKSFKCKECPPRTGEIGIVKVSAVTWGEFDENESKTITDRSKINRDYGISVGDFLFSRANTIELVGACVIVRNMSKDLLLSDKILRFDFVSNLNEWILPGLRTRHGRAEIESLATGNQESMRNISQANINKIRIPLPPIQEQIQIPPVSG